MLQNKLKSNRILRWLKKKNRNLCSRFNNSNLLQLLLKPLLRFSRNIIMRSWPKVSFQILKMKLLKLLLFMLLKLERNQTPDMTNMAIIYQVIYLQLKRTKLKSQEFNLKFYTWLVAQDHLELILISLRKLKLNHSR